MYNTLLLCILHKIITFNLFTNVNNYYLTIPKNINPYDNTWRGYFFAAPMRWGHKSHEVT